MDNRPREPTEMAQLFRLICEKIAHLESELKQTNHRIDAQENEIRNKICIPCPAVNCLKSFKTISHRNRHIRDMVKKGEAKEPLWKDHEDVRVKLGLLMKESAVSDDSDQEDDMCPADAAAPTSVALQDTSAPVEVRTTQAPEFASPTSFYFQVHHPYAGLEMNNWNDENPFVDWQTPGNLPQGLAPGMDVMPGILTDHNMDFPDSQTLDEMFGSAEMLSPAEMEALAAEIGQGWGRSVHEA